VSALLVALCLAAAVSRQREALEAEGLPDHSPATQFVCEVYAVFLQKLAEEHHGHFTHKDW
jgi:hypothetical protein